MSNHTNPWEGLSTPRLAGSYSTKRVSYKTPHNFYWGKNEFDQFCLIFCCDLTKEVQLDHLALKGIEIEQIITENKEMSLIVKLIEGHSRDIFRTISSDLISTTDKIPVDQPTMVVNAINVRLKRWQDLLSKKEHRLLSRSEQIGLFGEILFLRDIFLPNTELVGAVESWQGPFGSEQDFGWSHFLFEVKTQLTTSDKKVTISSLEQLDHISGEIWLVSQTLAADEIGVPEKVSLHGLIEQVKEILSDDVFAYDRFCLILLEFGYETCPGYDEISYSLAQRMFFKTDGNFPKLIRSNLPTEIVSSRYVLDVSALLGFEVLERDIIAKVFGNGQN